MPEVARYWNEERGEWRPLLASDPVLHLGPEAPTGPEDLWVDTDEDIPTGGGAASWDDLTGKPETFPPSEHTHDDRYYTEAEVDEKVAALGSTLSWKGAIPATTPAEMDALPIGIYGVPNSATAEALGLPDAYGGVLTNIPYTPSTGMREFRPFARPGRIWSASRNFSSTWSEWMNVGLSELASRLAVLERDTGWRDITLPGYLATGVLKLRRTTAGVHLRLIASTGISGKSVWTGAIPTGYRPAGWEFTRTVPIWSGEQDANLRIEPDGTIRFQYAKQDMAAPINVSFFYACDQAWPNNPT